MTRTTTRDELRRKIQNEIDYLATHRSSAWERATWADADALAENLPAEVPCAADYKYLKNLCLNGASDFYEYSYGGSALIYDADIAEHYCTPSELKRTKHGEKQPNRTESWLDLQARALNQAFSHLWTIFIALKH